MNNIIVKQMGHELRVDSRIIAKRLGVDHKATLQVIDRYQEQLKRFGPLPFKMRVVNRPQSGGSNKVGREYAAHFAQYLKDNPSSAGHNILGLIVSDMDLQDESASKSYWVGCFAHLETLIYAQASCMDVFGHVDHIAAYHANCKAKSDSERGKA